MIVLPLIGYAMLQGRLEEKTEQATQKEAYRPLPAPETGRSWVSVPDLEKYFRKHRQITFSEDVLIAEISSLDVGDNGDLLIVDGISRKIWIFNDDGDVRSELDPEACHPGFMLLPMEAQYAPTGYILLTNSGLPGYRFNVDGSCLGRLHREFTPPRSFSFDDHGYIYGAHHSSSERLAFQIVIRDAEGKKVRHFDLAKEAFPYLVGQTEGGGVVYQNGYLFHVSVAAPIIYKYTPDGELEQTYSVKPKFYRPLKEDFPAVASSPNFFKKVGQIFRESTLITDFWALDHEKLLLLYVNDEGVGFQVVSTEGVVLAEYLGMDFPFIHAQNGLAYRVIQPELDEQGELPNPYLEVYRYVGPEKP